MNKLLTQLGLLPKVKQPKEAIPLIKCRKVVAYETPATFNEISNNILIQKQNLR